MDIVSLKSKVKENISNDRFLHTLRVMDEAVVLAERYGESTEKAMLAALLHDYAKCLPAQLLKDKITEFQLPVDLLKLHHELWHGPVGAELAKSEFQIDSDIYHAIYYHTTARESMSKLELIIFVADYIEPARDFTGIKEVRELAKINLEQAAQKVLQQTIIYLIKQNAIVHPDSFSAYNALTIQIGSGK